MAAMDEFREEREAIKNGTFKQKWEYFWDYYKIHTIVAIVLIVFLGNVIYEQITATDPILAVNFINAHNTNKDYTIQNVLDEFIEEQNIDTKEYHIDSRTNLYYMPEVEIAKNPTSSAASSSASSNYNTMQIISAQAGADMLDALVAPHTTLNELAYMEYFTDLTEILSEEEYAKYEPYFLYMDMAIIEERHEAYDNGKPVSDIPIATSNSAEDLKKPIPICIDLSHCENLMNAYGNHTESLAIGIIKNASHKDMAFKFIDFVMK